MKKNIIHIYVLINFKDFFLVSVFFNSNYIIEITRLMMSMSERKFKLFRTVSYSSPRPGILIKTVVKQLTITNILP